MLNHVGREFQCRLHILNGNSVLGLYFRGRHSSDETPDDPGHASRESRDDRAEHSNQS
jgi:hypothetical protein